MRSPASLYHHLLAQPATEITGLAGACPSRAANVSVLGLKAHPPDSKLNGLEVLGEKKVIPFLKSVVRHLPTAKVCHPGRALQDLRIAFSGARTAHPWEKAEAFPGEGWGPHTLLYSGNSGIRGRHWPKASTQPYCCTNALLYSKGQTGASWTEHPLPTQPSSPPSAPCRNLPVEHSGCPRLPLASLPPVDGQAPEEFPAGGVSCLWPAGSLLLCPAGRKGVGTLEFAEAGRNALRPLPAFQRGAVRGAEGKGLRAGGRFSARQSFHFLLH